MPKYPLKKLIVVAGPTASGKTALAIALAQAYSTVVISADSRQLYHELNLGVARPDPEELEQAPHYMIANYSIYEPITAFEYEERVIELLKLLFREHEVIILCGGTGLYLKAVIEGLDDIPLADQEIVLELEDQVKNTGLQTLAKELIELDPEYAKGADLNNPRRVIRALGVIKSTGLPYSSFLGKKQTQRWFSHLVFGLEWDRNELYERINHRVDIMIQNGLLDEVIGLQDALKLKPLQTVGYKEFIPFFEGKISMGEAISKIKQHSRNYAKRQMTWFKNQMDIHWLNPHLPQEKLIKTIQQHEQDLEARIHH